MDFKIHKGETGAERRKYPRMPLKLRLSYQCLSKDSVSPSEEHLAEDLGAGGLAMRSPERLVKDQILMITIFLPRADKRLQGKAIEEYRETDCVGVDILARVAWCKSRGPNNYLVGIQFLDLDGNSREILKKFLMDFRLYQSDSPLNY